METAMSAQGYRGAASRTIQARFPPSGRQASAPLQRAGGRTRAAGERRKRFGFCYLFACFWAGEGGGTGVWLADLR